VRAEDEPELTAAPQRSAGPSGAVAQPAPAPEESQRPTGKSPGPDLRLEPATGPVASAPSPGPVGLVDTPEAFLELLSRYRQPLAAHLAHADALRIEGRTLRVFVGDPAFLERALRRPANREALERALGEGLGDGAGWELVSASAGPADNDPEPDSGDGEVSAEVADHPTVQAALELFGGTIESIEPREDP
jgi:hypothetical protein